MNPTVALITLSVATMLAGAGIVLAFFPRIPATLLSYAGMAVAAMSGLVAFTAPQLWFWGLAAVIAALIARLSPRENDRLCRIYTISAALVGSLVGLAGGTTAWVIIASASGAALGFMASRHTPRGASAGAVDDTVGRVAATALPAVVNFSTVMLIFAQLIQI